MHRTSSFDIWIFYNSILVASDLRQVPDTQEVFLDLESDMSVIVEILERVDTEDAKSAVMSVWSYLYPSFTDRWQSRFHFDSLAYDNSASSQQVFDVILPAEPQATFLLETPHPIILHGEQTVQKFNSTIPDQVCLFVALFRIEAKGVDLVLTINMPISMAEDTQPGDDGVLQDSKQKFDAAARSLKILDFDLFAWFSSVFPSFLFSTFVVHFEL